MASKLSVAIRQQEAVAKLNEATASLGLRFGVEAGNLAPTHKDPDIERAEQLEALAEFLVKLEAASISAPVASLGHPEEDASQTWAWNDASLGQHEAPDIKPPAPSKRTAK